MSGSSALPASGSILTVTPGKSPVVPLAWKSVPRYSISPAALKMEMVYCITKKAGILALKV